MTGHSVLRRIADGNSEAVKECIDRYGGLIWSLARRFTRTQADAEDAVQEIFMEIWRSAARFDATVASETTFISMLARRRLIDRVRRTKKDATNNLESIDLESEDDPTRNLELGDEARIAMDRVKELPEEQSKVILLSVFHGMSQSKIAAATGMPLGTVKSSMRRGLSRLREALVPKSD